MRAPPRSGSFDSSLALLAEGYEFISRRCAQLGTDVFTTRLLGEPTICMRGRAAAELLYDRRRFQRAEAAPPRLRRTLFGQGGVQGLDGQDHRDRKAMLLSLMSLERIDELVELFTRGWRNRLPAWQRAARVELHGEAGLLLTEAVYRWAGVPLDPSETRRHRFHLQGMIVGGAAIGPRHLWGRASRRRGNRLMARVIERARTGDLATTEGTALHAIAFHTGRDGRRLDPGVAAVELLNVLRPTVAVGHYIVFAALALHEHPEWRERLRAGGDELAEQFVLEVRRTTPFFPFVAARVREDFTWQGFHLARGRRVLLDLLGTNLDGRIWPEPTRFRPERFARWDGDAFSLVPQGGGEHAGGHRCAGEWITIALMKAAVRELTQSMDYRVPPQDLRVFRGHMPAAPRSGFVIEAVTARGGPPSRRGRLTPAPDDGCL